MPICRNRRRARPLLSGWSRPHSTTSVPLAIATVPSATKRFTAVTLIETLRDERHFLALYMRDGLGTEAQPPPAKPETPVISETPEGKKAPALAADSNAPSADQWITGSFDLGYQWRTDPGGNANVYRSIVDLGEGPSFLTRISPSWTVRTAGSIESTPEPPTGVMTRTQR